ncbi:MAG: hypothetical protein AUI83_01060 [Armatimonadetes bacterium 13_1_40CM_3_65_7]|nr:MAG: hypothetical protein AUI83_01060 [Armatimonadetes bacterium 13_1_40CM_3_65_7]
MSHRRSPILFVIALLVAAACSQPPPSASSPTPQATGGAASTLVWYADTSDLISLDPAVAYEFTGVLLAHNAYETLVKFDGADLSTIKPALAQSWDIKDSGTQWDITFKLRSGAKFASGNAITADDVVYSFQRVLKLNKSPAFLFTDIAQIKDSSIKASDPSTVVISLPKTASPQGFLAVLTFTIGLGIRLSARPLIRQRGLRDRPLDQELGGPAESQSELHRQSEAGARRRAREARA